MADEAATSMPSFIPASVDKVQEPAAMHMLSHLQRTPVTVPSMHDLTIQTAFYEGKKSKTSANRPPVVMLHGYDGCCLEFRRLVPLLEGSVDAWAIDVVRFNKEWDQAEQYRYGFIS